MGDVNHDQSTANAPQSANRAALQQREARAYFRVQLTRAAHLLVSSMYAWRTTGTRPASHGVFVERYAERAAECAEYGETPTLDVDALATMSLAELARAAVRAQAAEEQAEAAYDERYGFGPLTPTATNAEPLACSLSDFLQTRKGTPAWLM